MIVCNKGWKPLGCKTKKIKSKADTEKLSVIAACLHRFVPVGRPKPRTLFNDSPAKVCGHLSTYSRSHTKVPPNNCSLHRWVRWNSRMRRVSPQTHYDSDIPLPPFPSCNLLVVLHSLLPPPLHFFSQPEMPPCILANHVKTFFGRGPNTSPVCQPWLVYSRMCLRGNGSMTSSIFNRGSHK